MPWQHLTHIDLNCKVELSVIRPRINLNFSLSNSVCDTMAHILGTGRAEVGNDKLDIDSYDAATLLY